MTGPPHLFARPVLSRLWLKKVARNEKSAINAENRLPDNADRRLPASLGANRLEHPADRSRVVLAAARQ
jgi:hypothetical protein